ncbi:hypothetical protein R8871_06641 [Paraburkholderia graminis C4D1M]|uniref:Uncharacterized protein n=1 Tax=Paraburkholderia graminis (strain ATCC 700544 / DSM 17151 / LMG 18924 / NCIMB 13744 / C4D1M) TaxID=396598 RepID=B1G9L3_PARG4|nr:hypothetical protein BgramDRAFT_6050 [Paraburkholderia graminis C4D1M]CAB3740876.1 hypothetical protein R8871_06641 [Paraburkholderia graminis C4D1M]
MLMYVLLQAPQQRELSDICLSTKIGLTIQHQRDQIKHLRHRVAELVVLQPLDALTHAHDIRMEYRSDRVLNG